MMLAASFVAIVAMLVGNAFLVPTIPSELSGLVVFHVEVLKLSISGFMVYYGKEKVVFDIRQFLYLLVPGVIYAINNNLTFHVVPIVGVMTFQVLAQGKILVTGIMTVWILKKPLSQLRWIALVILTCGVTIHSVTNDFSMNIPLTGFLLTLLLVSLSSFAGVFTELCYKSEEVSQSVWFKNAQLYFHGVWMNLLFAGSFGDEVWIYWKFFDPSFFLVYLTILNQVAIGISMGFLLKFHSSLVKNYIGSVAFTLVGLVGVIRMNHPLSLNLIICIALVFCSLVIRNHECKSDSILPKIHAEVCRGD